MRWLLLSVLVASTAFAQGRFGARAQFGPSWSQVGAGATWSGGLGQAWGPATPSWVNNRAGVQPLVPVTNHTGGYYPVAPIAPVVPIYYWTQPQQPAPPPQPVVIEREVIIERPAPEPVAPAPQPQVIVIQQPAPPPPAPVLPPPPPPEPPKQVGPREPGPDVYSWVDADGVVNYSTRAPTNVKAKKLPTLAK